MKKKLLSLALSLVMSLGLTVPALAAGDLTGNQLYPAGNWDDGPSLVLKGVTAEHAVKLDPIHECCYDVVVGGSLVLEMPYPAGKNRTYVILLGGGYLASDFTPNYDLPNWSIPVAPGVEDISFGKDSGIRQYVYNFSESDIGKVDGCDQVIYVCLEWTDNEIGEDYVVDPGSGGVRFALRVIPAGAAVSPAGGFADVAVNSPYKDAIGWAVENGITNGISATKFGPDHTCTTRQILTFLWRANGKPGGAASGQSDLDAAVAWAEKRGILPTGTDASAPCTRASAVEFIWKAVGSPKPVKNDGFADLPVDASYADAVSWAVEKGITKGAGGGDYFFPDATCTRGQIVTFLYRASK